MESLFASASRPPNSPHGGQCVRSMRVLSAISPSTRTTLRTPRPPRWAPAPPESSRRLTSSSTQGNLASTASAGVLLVSPSLMQTTPLIPSLFCFAPRRQDDVERRERAVVDRVEQGRGQALERHLRRRAPRGRAGVVEAGHLAAH